MSNTFIDFQLLTSDFERKFRTLARDNPKYIRNGARAVNRAVVRDVKRELAQRGYSPHKPESFGDAGYNGKGNVSQAINPDLSGKIWFSKNYYHMKFTEYGANVRWRQKRGNFVLPPRPALGPKAKAYWETGKAPQIIENYLQQQYNKTFGGK